MDPMTSPLDFENEFINNFKDLIISNFNENNIDFIFNTSYDNCLNSIRIIISYYLNISNEENVKDITNLKNENMSVILVMLFSYIFKCKFKSNINDEDSSYLENVDNLMSNRLLCLNLKIDDSFFDIKMRSIIGNFENSVSNINFVIDNIENNYQFKNKIEQLVYIIYIGINLYMEKGLTNVLKNKGSTNIPEPNIVYLQYLENLILTI